MKTINAKVLIVKATDLGSFYFWPVEKGPACYQTSDEQVREIVKNDYLKRMKRWDRDALFIGSRTPKII
ncbi:hypothetical protein B4R02_14190 [Salmonella enterica]|uniref:Uncharacterized protein n=1 Tax=Salmonella enterica TaxID=28901 RepID=A0A754EBY2_SALER|nr:hypothetical protein [Salmonella enterica]EBE3720154.1 hypothetical protein [Salmonella enterica subsp. diarizonae serovar 42:l,v:1,5,7]ECF1925174.1 hypothetical protein [Salmonella enterica subsp. enterica serovar Newport]ECU9164128.1 hypothetical protein [Salmonella enterica subsp. enterica serovar Newport str. CFSAN000599]EDU1196829.1 hypothetical protein [Salmonella enterica subsp. enterica serovar Heidelberg str. CFSAN000576]EKO0249703.1 hypothetical protein [Salmonella enterica]